jgi:hypothetical protein
MPVETRKASIWLGILRVQPVTRLSPPYGAQFWRVFCLLLVRFCGIGHKRTNYKHFIQRGAYGSTKTGLGRLFILLGGIMVLAMHAGFAFLELGTVRKKNQVNALVKILVDFSVSTVAYFMVGYSVAYGTSFLRRRRTAGAKERLRAGEVLLSC